VATRKKKSLVIVESPAKAKTINKYLGTGFEVAASKGHVRDLPKTRFGIDIEGGWVPTYRSLDDRKAVLTALKKQAAQSDAVYLAPDPDREGEAIAWHLKEALGLSDKKTHRVTFNEITKKAVQEAFSNPGHINMDLVAAQEARRFLDRIVGYKLSPLLRKKVARHLSAGRVQSVAVRLIVEREREIQAFKPEEYWKIAAVLAPEGAKIIRKKADAEAKKKTDKKQEPEEKDIERDGELGEQVQADVEKKLEVPEGAFLAELAEWNGKKFEAKNGDEAKKIASALEGAKYVVAKVEQKDRPEKPSPPFTTSTLQQQASIRLHYSAKRTMMIAQRLYEGVELGSEGSVALITYMRTDSTRVSADALKSCREQIQSRFGAPYVPDQPNVYKSAKGAQDAHEAIRPTDLSYTPERVAPHLPHDQLRLYTLIYNRFMASQMTPAVFAVTNIDVSAAKGVFKAQGKILKFEGYRKVLPPAGKQEDALLPSLAEKQKLDLLELSSTQHFTQPPPRFNEASLVKSLEKEGIGRPSTYATIISKIQERGYVELKERRFHATEVGMVVTDKLIQHFPTVMDFKFTSHMEEELDQIEEGKIKRDQVLKEFYEPFSQALESAETQMETLKGVESGEACPQCGKPLVSRYGKRGPFWGCSGYPECKYTKPGEGEPGREAPVPTDHPCPECGKPMLQRMGRRGPFLGCSGYPDCKTTMNFDAEGKPVLSSKPTEHVCEKCGKPMVLREGARGPFLACSGYPKCRNAKDVDAKGNPMKPIETGEKCAKCGSAMVVKRGPRGPFLGCSAYPKCRSTKPVPEEMKEKLKTLLPPPPKKAVPAVEVTETCPECGAPMKLRPGRRGFFLGCSKYPKCKGTREASPEILERIQTPAGAT
jgi:DNA topoisomerase-1